MIIERETTVYSDAGVPITLRQAENWSDDQSIPDDAVKVSDGVLPEDDGKYMSYCDDDGVWRTRPNN